MPSTYGQIELDPSASKFSIIISTDLSDPLILDLLNSIRAAVPKDYLTEIIFVENSDTRDPDILTGKRKSDVIDQLLDFQKNQPRNHNVSVKLVRSDEPRGKTLAILDGIKLSNGENVIIMNDDFTHPPDILPRMMELLVEKDNRMVVASRFASGGSIDGTSRARKLIGSGAAVIARYGLKVKNKYTLKQFSLFWFISSFGAAIQLGLVYLLVEGGLQYSISLLIAVAVASAGNFLLNKKLTFKDRLWG